MLARRHNAPHLAIAYLLSLSPTPRPNTMAVFLLLFPCPRPRGRAAATDRALMCRVAWRLRVRHIIRLRLACVEYWREISMFALLRGRGRTQAPGTPTCARHQAHTHTRTTRRNSRGNPFECDRLECIHFAAPSAMSIKYLFETMSC